MKDCVLTTLNINVNNRSLEYRDAFHVFFTGTNKYLCTPALGWLLGGPNVKVKVLANGSIKRGNNIDEGTEYTLPSSASITCWVAPTDITKPTEVLLFGLSKMVSAGYNDTSLDTTMYSPTSEKIKYFTNWQPINTSESVKKLIILPSSLDGSVLTDISCVKDLPIDTVTVLMLPLGLLCGDISSFEGLSAISRINVNNNPKIIGNFSSFGKLKNISEIEIYNTNITGSVEDFVAAQVATPDSRTSGVINKFNCNGKITYNGNYISSGHHSITWDGNSITVGNDYIS